MHIGVWEVAELSKAQDCQVEYLSKQFAVVHLGISHEACGAGDQECQIDTYMLNWEC